VPLDPVPVLVVEDGKTGLVIELLKAIHSESAWVVHIVELARFQSFVVVGLSLTSNPSPAPECELAWDVGRRDSLVAVGPEPSVDVDRLKLGGVAALVPEVALPPRRPDRADVVCTRCVVIKGSKMWSQSLHKKC